MQNLINEMPKLIERIETVINEQRDHSDPHLITCERIADEFELWEPLGTEGGGRFPIWLSYVVQGVGRDNGILD